MKRLLILMLALLLCVSVLASCNVNVNTNTDPASDATDATEKPTEAPLFTPEQALKNAVAYLRNMYKAYLSANETASDFELVSSVKIADVDYTIEWTVDNEAVKVVKGDGKVVIDVDEKSATVVEYKLTGVVSAPGGQKSDPIVFKLKVPASNFVTIKEALAAADDTFVTVSGKVVLVNTPWDDGYKNISVTIEDENGDRLYLYRLATKVELGDILMVKGTMATYNNARQLAQGCTAEITGHEDVTLDYKKVTIADALKEKDDALVEVSGVVKTIDTPWSDSFKNISVTIMDSNGNELYIYRLATNVKQGDVITVKGIMATYGGNRQIAQGATAEITGHEDVVLTYKDVTIPEALAAEDGTLVSVKGTVKTINTAWSDSYGNITVTIVDADGKELYVYRLATKVEVGDILTIKGKVTSYEGKKQIAQGATATIDGKSDVVEPPVEYTKVTITEALEAADGTNIEVSGTVKIVNTAWSDSFGNISVTIMDSNGNELYIYRLSTKVAQGDIITVKGTMATYNEKRQVAQGATATITGKEDVVLEYKKVTIPEALEAEDDTLVEVSGTVKTINTAWSDSYGNISVTIVDANGKELYIFRLSTKVAQGDKITVKGIMDTYEGARQIAAGATAVIESNAEVSKEYKEVTIPEALVMGDGSLVIVKGTVKKINEKWSTQYNNITVTIEDADGNELYIYRLATNVNLGDEITVKGSLTTYNSKKQIAQGGTAEITKAHTECVYTTLSAKCDVCGAVKEHECADAGDDKLCDACGGKIVVINGSSLAVFTFGANGNAAHDDGDEMDDTMTSFTSGDKTLTFTTYDKVYSGATDAKGNSAIKLGTSKGTGTLAFTVGAEVKTVVLKIAKYKTYETVIDVNGEQYELVGASNDGEYDTVVIDTTTEKTVTIKTLTGTTRCMIDAIEYFG